jgi:hypothetical protein
VKGDAVEPLTLVLNAAGILLLEGRPVPIWELGIRAAVLLSGRPPEAKAVSLRMDRDQPLQRAMDILSLLKEAVPGLRVAMVLMD